MTAAGVHDLLNMPVFESLHQDRAKNQPNIAWFPVQIRTPKHREVIDHMPIRLSLTVDPQGQLVDCSGQAQVAQETVDQLCQAGSVLFWCLQDWILAQR